LDDAECASGFSLSLAAAVLARRLGIGGSGGGSSVDVVVLALLGGGGGATGGGELLLNTLGRRDDGEIAMGSNWGW